MGAGPNHLAPPTSNFPTFGDNRFTSLDRRDRRGLSICSIGEQTGQNDYGFSGHQVMQPNVNRAHPGGDNTSLSANSRKDIGAMDRMLQHENMMNGPRYHKFSIDYPKQGGPGWGRDPDKEM
jgi:hypothetical protein